MFDTLVSYENLIAAAHAASRGRRDRDYVIDFHHQLPEYLITLRRELIDGSYNPGPYREFHVYEHKQRLISAAPFRDRVVHHALCNQIYPLLDRRLGPTVFANRESMGAQRAVILAQRYQRRCRYFMKLDIRNYFPSIDHTILKDQLRRVIPCRRSWELASLIIDGSNSQESDTFFFPGDDLFTPVTRRRGLPIGNLTSPDAWASRSLATDQPSISPISICTPWITSSVTNCTFEPQSATSTIFSSSPMRRSSCTKRVRQSSGICTGYGW